VSIARKGDDQYMLRLPDGLRGRIKQHAAVNGRSLNSEIVDAIERHLERGDRLEELERRIAKLEQRA
jgi:predicted DNA-binding protein